MGAKLSCGFKLRDRLGVFWKAGMVVGVIKRLGSINGDWNLRSFGQTIGLGWRSIFVLQSCCGVKIISQGRQSKFLASSNDGTRSTATLIKYSLQGARYAVSP